MEGMFQDLNNLLEFNLKLKVCNTRLKEDISSQRILRAQCMLYGA